MVFKVFFRVRQAKALNELQFCKVLAVENGQELERRIDNTISNLKADGYAEVQIVDAWNISEPCPRI